MSTESTLFRRSLRDIVVCIVGILVGVLLIEPLWEWWTTRRTVHRILAIAATDLDAGRVTDAEAGYKRAEDLLYSKSGRLHARAQMLAGRIHHTRATEEITDLEAATDQLYTAKNCLERAQQFFGDSATTDQRALLDLYLGSTAGRLSTLQPRLNKTYTEEARAKLESAIQLVSSEANPNEYARAQNNLGNLYLSLAATTVGESTEVLYRSATAAFETAAALVARQPLSYAKVQNNIAQAYSDWALSAPDRDAKKTYFQNAFAAYDLALQEPFGNPGAHQMIEINRAETIINYATELGDEQVLGPAARVLQQALVSFQNAEDHYGYAKTTVALGLANRARAEFTDSRGDKLELLLLASQQIKEGIRKIEASDVQSRRGEFQEKLGDTFVELVELGDAPEYREKAVDAYEDARYWFDQKNYPRQHERISEKVKRIQ